MNKKLLAKIIPLFIFGFIAFLFYFTHYKEGYFILRGDTGYPLDPYIQLKNHSYSWFSSYWTGLPAGNAFNYAFPLLLIIILLNTIFDPIQSQFILLASLLFSCGFLSYFFFSLINPQKINNNILGGLFFMLNAPIIAEWYVPNPWFFLAYLSLPVTAIGCFYLVKSYWSGVSLLALGYVFVASGFANAPLIAINLILGILVLVYLKINRQVKIKRHLFLTATFITTFLLANLWWFALLVEYRQEGELILTSQTDITQWAIGSSRNANAFNILINRFTPVMHGDSLAYVKFLNNSPVSWIYAFFPVIFLSYLWKKKKEAHIVFLLFIYIAIIFLVKGTQPPLGTIYVYLLKNLPYFSIFKTPAEKFGVLYLFWQALMISILFKRTLHIAFGIFIVLALAYPVYTGNLFGVVTVANGDKLVAYQKVPSSYYDVAKLINDDQKLGRVLLLPEVPNYQVTYESTNFRGLDWMRTLQKKALIGGWSIKEYNAHFFIENITDEKIFTGWTRRFNIDWIILNKDLLSDRNNPSGDPERIEMILDANKNFKRVGSFGKLIVYKLKVRDNTSEKPSEEILPHLYIPSKVMMVN